MDREHALYSVVMTLDEGAGYSIGSSSVMGRCDNDNGIEDVRSCDSQQRPGGLVLLRLIVLLEVVEVLLRTQRERLQ